MRKIQIINNLKKRKKMITKVPNVVFKTRVRNDALEESNPFEWKDISTANVFNNKKVVVFSTKVHSLRLAQHLTSHATKNSKHKALMLSFAYR